MGMEADGEDRHGSIVENKATEDHHERCWPISENHWTEGKRKEDTDCRRKKKKDGEKEAAEHGGMVLEKGAGSNNQKEVQQLAAKRSRANHVECTPARHTRPRDVPLAGTSSAAATPLPSVVQSKSRDKPLASKKIRFTEPSMAHENDQEDPDEEAMDYNHPLYNAKTCLDFIPMLNGQDDVGVEGFIKRVREARTGCKENYIVQLEKPSLLYTNQTTDILYGNNHMRISGSAKNVSYDIKIKSVNITNDTDWSAMLDILEKTPKVISDLYGYTDTLNQIEAKANQLTFSHRITQIKSWKTTVNNNPSPSTPTTVPSAPINIYTPMLPAQERGEPRVTFDLTPNKAKFHPSILKKRKNLED
ncbi:hypothetical protein WN55_01933 [Dufourea novaeangliae]|uniref:Uncharacterized protein n=1 Tax=Dufourea novaeangliae TaxID=178035 RepID=A0A154PEE1_DUFNO|nr:hypothetical protein WN55_01933 [Dufourea novaeangliae]